MDTFEIRDEEIDVEEIMRKIRENIRMRREAGIYPEGEIEEISPTRASGSCHPDQIGDAGAGAGAIGLSPEARRDLDHINSTWDVENKSYFISSHRPVAGKFLIRGRELVHGEVRRYVDPAIWKQREFNASTTRLLNEVAKGLEEMGGRLAKIEAALQEARSETAQMRSDLRSDLSGFDASVNERIASKVQDVRLDIGRELSRLDTSIDERIASKVQDVRSEIGRELSGLDTSIDERIASKVQDVKSDIGRELSGLDSKIEERVRREANAVISAMDLEIKSMASLASILEGRMKGFEDVPLSSDPPDYEGMNYFVFEEAFRGSRETIKERQAAFVRYFEGSKNVLDIGCGRGEFLELLRERGIGGRGIDLNEDMVDYCRSKGFDVERIDAIAYLEGLEEKSLDGVFLDQVVEHLRPDYMVKMLGLCYKKMKYGHHIVVETVNPLSFTSLANFYIDLTHVRPIHPETLRFLLGAVGFREVETRFFSPVPDEGRLSRFELEEEKRGQMGSFAAIYDHNVDMITNILYGAQDYAIIGKK